MWKKPRKKAISDLHQKSYPLPLDLLDALGIDTGEIRDTLIDDLMDGSD